MDAPRRPTWANALACYDGLISNGWEHIRGFRELVAWISQLKGAAGLTPVTSHETLILSPYTRYPDWFGGRHVRLHPLSDGTVRIERYEGERSKPVDTWTGTIEEARDRLSTLISNL